MKEPMNQPSFRPAAKQPPAHAPNAALLIDFDNVTMGIRSDLQQELRRLMSSDIIRGKVAVQRAYADWRRYPQYIVPLSEASIDLIFAPAFGSNKKNATDIRLAMTAAELAALCGMEMVLPMNTGAEAVDLVELLKTLGEPAPVAEKIGTDAVGLARFSVSRNGVLAYRTGNSGNRLLWMDRDGKELETVGAPGEMREELRRAIKAGALGITMPTNGGGVYPDDERYLPFFEDVEKAGMPVFFHPTTLTPFGHGSLRHPLITPVFQYAFDTSICMAKVVGMLTKERRCAVT